MKNFSNHGRLFSYDVSEGTFAVTSATQFNTEANYYSEEMEQQLSQNIERPLGVLAAYLKTQFDSGLILIKKKHIQTIRNYVYALLARSPNMFISVWENLIFKEFFTFQQIHDLTVTNSFRIMQQENFLSGYKITFLFNKTPDEILLASDGYTQYQAGQEIVLIIPMTPKIAFMMYQGTDLYDGKIVYTDIKYLSQLNKITIEQQKQRGHGHVLASKKEQLEKVIADKKR